MRKEYKLTPEQLKKLKEASKPTPVMYLSGGQLMHKTQRENVNEAFLYIAYRFIEKA